MTYMSFLAVPLLCLAACMPAQEISDVRPETTIGTMTKNPAGNNVSSENLAAWRKNVPDWYAAVEPFRLVGDEERGVYYVGTEGLAMYFIPTDQGHIVIDGGMPEQGAYVAEAIRKLGYEPEDIKILLNSHAHLDHSGGLAELKALSGAQMIASEGDRSALEGGFYLGAEEETHFNAPPVKVDRIIADGEKVTLGGITLMAQITPGHSRGCTSWTMSQPVGGDRLEILFFCSATVAANRLVGPPQYDGIVDDYRKTFAKTKNWKPDIFFANHPGFFAFKQKRESLLAGNPMAFVDNESFPKSIAKLAVDFEDALVKQKIKLNEGN